MKNGDDWPTPDWLKRALNWEKRYDPFPLYGIENVKIQPSLDGLSREWYQDSVINPPFSHLAEAVQHGIKQPRPQYWIVPGTPDRSWFQTLALQKDVEIAYFFHRIFKGSNFPTALVILK